MSEANCTEVWKDVPGYENRYQASNLGRVKSLGRPRFNNRFCYGMIHERILGLNRHNAGYRWTTLYKDGKPWSILVHRLVLLTFVGPCPLGMEACHGDGDPANNRLENLRWDTSENNKKDKERHGTYLYGEIQHSSKLTEEEVRCIRMLYSTGKYTQKRLARMFSLSSQMTISKIVRRETWRHTT